MAIKTFTTGEVLTAADTNTYLANSGLVFVKSQTVGTAVSSVTVADAFSATYDNYKIVYSGGTASALCLISVYMGTAAAANGYFGARNSSTVAGVFNGTGNNNTGEWTLVSAINTNFAVVQFDLWQPFNTLRTGITSNYMETNVGFGTFGTYSGYLDNATSYTSFTLDPQAANTITGGTVTVYGYRKA